MQPSAPNRPRLAEALSRDGTCISYVTHGRGRPLVMLRDRQPASAAWAVAAAHWPAGRQAVLPDPRGCGWSARPVHAGAYALQRLADDLEAVLAAVRQPVELLASGGATEVALALAQRPIAARVRRWILISGFPAAAPPERVLQDHVPSFRSPVLVLHGDRDRQCPLASAREFARRQSHARFEVLPGIGHDPMREAPARTWRVIESFLCASEGSSVTLAATRYSCFL